MATEYLSLFDTTFTFRKEAVEIVLCLVIIRELDMCLVFIKQLLLVILAAWSRILFHFFKKNFKTTKGFCFESFKFSYSRMEGYRSLCRPGHHQVTKNLRNEQMSGSNLTLSKNLDEKGVLLLSLMVNFGRFCYKKSLL